ncbi:MAG: SCO family protein [Proteobacteria bacterium]|nr:SCO family protein [Pseudomonadota bacterium]
MRKKLINLTYVLISLLWLPQVVFATTQGQQDFDNKTALKISQGAIGNTLAGYTFTQPDGNRLSLDSLRGKPLVISLIYTSCYHICPTTTRHLANVVRKARDVLGDDSFNVLTIGFDTSRDTVDSMRQFAAHQDIDMPGWYFLSMDQKTMKGLTRDLGFIYKPSAMGFDHLIQASVIDADGKIYRQVYEMKFETPMLIEPIKELVFGRPKSNSLVEHIGNRIRLFCTVYDPKSDRYITDYSIFVGMFIGITSLLFVGFLVVREWRRGGRA